MTNKILITGGAGFIGSYLINKIKNKKKILVVDKVKNKKTLIKFKKLNIKYIYGNLLNINFCKKIYKNVDIIYHLAGDVKVPNTDFNLDKKKEIKIFNEATKIMQNLISFTNKNTKIILPSTHLIFENCKKNNQIFYETSLPLTNLAYSRSKLKCEQMIKESGLKFNILRLGSVYGLAENKKRMFNLPNLFPLRAKKKFDLKLFSDGIQIKSIISVKDVVRAMVFLSKNKYNNEIYHLVSEHFTVREIAEICKSINPKLKLNSTKDKIPYVGYHMNCDKILKKGFKFKYLYKNFMKEFL